MSCPAVFPVAPPVHLFSPLVIHPAVSLVQIEHLLLRADELLRGSQHHDRAILIPWDDRLLETYETLAEGLIVTYNEMERYDRTADFIAEIPQIWKRVDVMDRIFCKHIRELREGFRIAMFPDPVVGCHLTHIT